ncbi:MAG: hypothetical protein K0R23_1631 [Lacrimispora sp.]|nr:hypothetical protein [Lacrimispora sp.]
MEHPSGTPLCPKGLDGNKEESKQFSLPFFFRIDCHQKEDADMEKCLLVPLRETNIPLKKSVKDANSYRPYPDFRCLTNPENHQKVQQIPVLL